MYRISVGSGVKKTGIRRKKVRKKVWKKKCVLSFFPHKRIVGSGKSIVQRNSNFITKFKNRLIPKREHSLNSYSIKEMLLKKKFQKIKRESFRNLRIGFKRKKEPLKRKKDRSLFRKKKKSKKKTITLSNKSVAYKFSPLKVKGIFSKNFRLTLKKLPTEIVVYQILSFYALRINIHDLFLNMNNTKINSRRIVMIEKKNIKYNGVMKDQDVSIVKFFYGRFQNSNSRTCYFLYRSLEIFTLLQEDYRIQDPREIRLRNIVLFQLAKVENLRVDFAPLFPEGKPRIPFMFYRNLKFLKTDFEIDFLKVDFLKIEKLDISQSIVLLLPLEEMRNLRHLVISTKYHLRDSPYESVFSKVNFRKLKVLNIAQSDEVVDPSKWNVLENLNALVGNFKVSTVTSRIFPKIKTLSLRTYERKYNFEKKMLNGLEQIFLFLGRQTGDVDFLFANNDFKNLKSLKCGSGYYNKDIVGKGWRKNMRLKRFELYNCHGFLDDFFQSEELQIEELSLRMCENIRGDKWGRKLVKNLVMLKIWDCHEFGEKIFKKRIFGNLTHLSLGYVDFTGRGWKKMKKLKHFEMNRCYELSRSIVDNIEESKKFDVLCTNMK